MDEQQLDTLDDFLGRFDMVEDVDPEAMTTDAPAPPPEFDEHGRIAYTIKCTLAKGAGGDKAIALEAFPEKCVTLTKKGKPQIIVDFVISSENPRYHGQSAREWIGTTKMGATTPVDTLLLALTGTSGALRSDAQKIKDLYNLLVTEPVMLASIKWSLDGTDEPYTTFLKGMKSFPTVVIDGATVYRPLEADPETGTPARTRWRIGKYLRRTASTVIEDEGLPF